MAEKICSKCDEKYELEISEEKSKCPNCNFEPKCNHPIEERKADNIIEVENRSEVERFYCGNCGKVLD